MEGMENVRDSRALVLINGVCLKRMENLGRRWDCERVEAMDPRGLGSLEKD